MRYRFLLLMLIVLELLSGQGAGLPAWLTPYGSGRIGTDQEYTVKASVPEVSAHYNARIKGAGGSPSQFPVDDTGGVSVLGNVGSEYYVIRIALDGSEQGVHVSVQHSTPEQIKKAAKEIAHAEGNEVPARPRILSKAIPLTVVRKDFIPSDSDQHRYEARISIQCSYQNVSGYDIRAFTGIIRFTDLFGREIHKVRVTISDPARTGAMEAWSGDFHFNQFIEAHRVLANTPLQNMKVVWIPTSIIFSDGVMIGDPQ